MIYVDHFFFILNILGRLMMSLILMILNILSLISSAIITVNLFLNDDVIMGLVNQRRAD